ncbi:MAG: hypothetical protein ACRD0U_01755, partial [Acidimicrobiales bacterium]
GLAIDMSGQLWIADPFCGTLERLDDDEVVEVTHDVADVTVPIDLGFDRAGNLYILDAGSQAILRIAADDLPRAEP